MHVYPVLQKQIQYFEQRFALIHADRKAILHSLTDFIVQQQENRSSVLLNFICTHNSRRSHIAQIWAQCFAHHYEIDNVLCYSGGTEATAFNPRAVQAMRSVGFLIDEKKPGDNPIYEVSFADQANPLTIFSKRYDDPINPKDDFAAIMTCSHADENCPVVFGMRKRISLPYNDPKDFDGTSQEAEKYIERVLEIGSELCYAFWSIKNKS